jgi:hypothetical protein
MWSALLLLLLSPIFAQDATTSAVLESTPSATIVPLPTIDPVDQKISQYTKDYIFSKDLFNQAYLVYTNKKQTHTRYGTIITKEEKLKATREVLIARNTMLRTYLLALRVRLDKHLDSSPTDTEKVKIEISKLEDWLAEQNTIVSSLLEKDFDNNQFEFKTKYNLFLQTAYSALVQEHLNHNLYIQAMFDPIMADLQQSNLTPEGQQLLSETKVKLDLANRSLAAAKEAAIIKPNTIRFSDFYPTSKTELQLSKSYLSQIIQNIEGIVLRFL